MSKYLIAAIAWGIVVTVFSVIPSEDLPYKKSWSIYDADTLLHIVVFAIFSLLLILGFKDRKASFKLPLNPYLTAFLISLAYGTVLEFVQIPIPQRGFEWTDLLANTIGTCAGVGIIFVLIRK